MRAILITVLLAAAALQAAAQTFAVRLHVDDATRVALHVGDLPYESLASGPNDIPCLPGTRLTVSATPGNTLLAVTETDGSWTDDLPIADNSCTINIFGNFGSEYRITSAAGAGLSDIEALSSPSSTTLYRPDGTPARPPYPPGLYISAGSKVFISAAQ